MTSLKGRDPVAIWGVPLSAQDEMLHAVYRCDSAAVAALKQRGVKIIWTDFGSVMFFAGEQSFCMSVEVLQESGVHGINDPLGREPDGVTVLHVAACYDNPRVIRFLLGLGADIHACRQGLTPLAVAVGRVRWVAAKELLCQGATLADVRDWANVDPQWRTQLAAWQRGLAACRVAQRVIERLVALILGRDCAALSGRAIWATCRNERWSKRK